MQLIVCVENNYYYEWVLIVDTHTTNSFRERTVFLKKDTQRKCAFHSFCHFRLIIQFTLNSVISVLVTHIAESLYISNHYLFKSSFVNYIYKKETLLLCQYKTILLSNRLHIINHHNQTIERLSRCKYIFVAFKHSST